MTRAAAAPAAAALDPQQHYVRLAADGSSRVLQGGEAFWRLPAAALDSIGESWVISEFECSDDWPNWEMHPNAALAHGTCERAEPDAVRHAGGTGTQHKPAHKLER